jgi:putative phosphoesterase
VSDRFVGLISDTHDLMRPEALDALQGSRLILHAGDVGSRAVLDRLREIAPVCAVRGHTDVGETAKLPYTQAIDVDGVQVYLLHILDDLDLDPAAAGFGMVMYGHTHAPKVERRGGVWYVNPGSAGPRRFSLPVSVGRLRIEGGEPRVELVTLEPAAGR